MNVKKKAGRNKIKTTPRGALLAIALLLLGSASIRLGLGANQAIALESATAGSETSEDQLACETPGDFNEMIKALKEREDRVVAQEKQIARRLSALALADEKIEAKLASLTAAEDELRATLALADDAAENDLSRLTTVYENMKPKDAAALFEQMDPEFSAGFLARMKPAAAATIMAGLTSERAYSISVILAGRNAKVPTE